jgi:hypothetical protein
LSGEFRFGIGLASFLANEKVSPSVEKVQAFVDNTPDFCQAV